MITLAEWLLARKVISRVRSTFELSLGMETLFRCPTVAELTEHVDTLCWRGPRDVMIAY